MNHLQLYWRKGSSGSVSTGTHLELISCLPGILGGHYWG
jgi:hypothetical protein